MDTIELPFLLKIFRKIHFPKKLGLLELFFGKNLAQHGVCWVKTSEGVIWKLDLRNSTHRWIVYGNYEGDGFIPWAKKNLKSNSVIIDSGANIGQVLLYLAPIVTQGKYIAFEPFVTARNWLLECIEKYKSWRVLVEPFALGEEERFGSLTFDTGGESAVGSHSQIIENGNDIKILTLDKYCEEKNIKKIDLWKMDMEGFELKALKGASNLLLNKAIKRIVIEVSIDTFDSIYNYLLDKGYKIVNWDGTIPQKYDGSYGNVLFVC